MRNHVLSGLAKRRTELLSEVKKQENVLRGLLADLDHLDSAVRMFDSSHRSKSRPMPARPRGSVTKAILAALREAAEPLTSRETALRAMSALGMDMSDRKRVNRMVEQCRVALAKHRKRGTVAAQATDGMGLVWRVAE